MRRTTGLGNTFESKIEVDNQPFGYTPLPPHPPFLHIHILPSAPRNALPLFSSYMRICFIQLYLQKGQIMSYTDQTVKIYPPVLL